MQDIKCFKPLKRGEKKQNKKTLNTFDNMEYLYIIPVYTKPTENYIVP